MENQPSSIQSTCPTAGGLLSSSPYFCLVPETLYREEDKDLWLNFLHEHIPHDQQIQVDIIAENACVCLHQKETDQQEEHCIAHLLRLAQSIQETDKLLCIYTEGHLCTVLFLHGQLQLANVFEITADNDCLYYLLSIYQQYNIPPHTLPVHIAGLTDHLREVLTPYIDIHSLSL